MGEKKLIVKFHRGVNYEVPARIIAENRANYYAFLGEFEKDSEEYYEEFNIILNDEFELFDWVQNNMRWHDLEPYAVRLENNEPIDLDEEWSVGNTTMSTNF